MDRLSDWIEYGRCSGIWGAKRKVRRWLNEARAHIPVIDRVNYPETGRDCRLSRRG